MTPLCAQPVALQGVVVAKVQDQALGLAKPHPIGISPSIQPVQVPLQSPSTLYRIDTSSQFGVVCKFADGGHDLLIQIIKKDIDQDWAQH
ncbi:integral membrane protein dgcr2 idd [Willisornis vidua]|uniref:Integral membrane protein dgcr2 idd n=1 Tax=Willisornis vidua TaxID=1566151 RepID=A0ABQ9DXP8_9PASS|nr:integral membrane protein dgcr2 idd [Willisornis vidua]